MPCKIRQSVCSDCVTCVKSRIKFNIFNTFNNVKAIKQIKITKFTLGDIKKLECVKNIKTVDVKVTVYLKKDMTNGRLEANMNQFLVKFQNGMWQVYGSEAINRLYKNPGKEAGNQWG